MRLVVMAVLVLAAAAPDASGQQARVDTLAGLVAMEDARGLDSLLLARALASRDPLIRRTAAIAGGRIGDRRATTLVALRLRDRNPWVRAGAAFALGLLRDSAGVDPLADVLTGGAPLDSATPAEAATSLARIGGRRASAAIAELLDREITVPGGRRAARATLAAALLESWRLGKDASVAALRRYAGDSAPTLRWAAVFSLSRLRPPEAARDLVAAAADPLPETRSFAVRALTKAYAEKAGLRAAEVVDLLARAGGDPHPGVRINALAALATFRDSALASIAVARLEDSVVNVRVQAAAALGMLSGAQASARLAALAGDSDAPWAARRTALVALASIDAGAFERSAAGWRQSRDWRYRAAVAEGWVAAGRATAPSWLEDADSRVIAAGLQAWSDAVPGPDSALVALARPLLSHPDAGVRSLAADALARAPDPRDVSALARMYAATGQDSFPNAAMSALKTLAAIAAASDSGRSVVERGFLDQVSRPDDYQLRLWAEQGWPAAASRWGPGFPLATGRTVADYRLIVRRRLLGRPAERRPRVLLVTAGSEPVEVELLGPDAPLTVEHFLALVDRRFFDGDRWHRVVPNFVVQDGDPRGDGWGGPPGAIRDEINPVRYRCPVLGMALDGPDSGNSQWFINLSSQPHLDGTYTVFGKVVVGATARGLGRIAQGDSIVSIRRVR